MSKSRERAHWLVKQEAGTYSWDQFVVDGRTCWDGVRNYQARNNLRAMKVGDLVLFYRSVEKPAAVGICRVVRSAFPDPTAEGGDWVAVELAPVRSLDQPVPLRVIKDHKSLKKMTLLRQSRLSVLPLTPSEFATIVELGSKSRAS